MRTLTYLCRGDGDYYSVVLSHGTKFLEIARFCVLSCPCQCLNKKRRLWFVHFCQSGYAQLPTMVLGWLSHMLEQHFMETLTSQSPLTDTAWAGQNVESCAIITTQVSTLLSSACYICRGDSTVPRCTTLSRRGESQAGGKRREGEVATADSESPHLVLSGKFCK